MTDPAPASRPDFWKRLSASWPEQPLVLAAAALLWALAWMALEAWFLKRGTAPWLQALAPALACALAAWADRGDRLAQSRLLPGILAAVTLAALGGGWLVVRARSGEVQPGGILDGPFSILATARSADLLRSLWLEALLMPLAAWALARAWGMRSALRTAPSRLLLLAAAPVLALAAMLNVGAGTQAEGPLTAGAPQGAFEGVRPAGPVTLGGLQLRLDSVDSARREPAYRLQVPGPRTWTSAVEPGQHGDLPGGLRYQVERLVPSALPSGQVEEDPRGAPNPALQVMLGLGNAEPLIGVLFARESGSWRREEPGGRFTVGYRDRFDADLLRSLQPHPPLRQKLLLTVLGRTLEHPAKLGEVWDLPGFSLTVTGVYPDFGGVRTASGGRRELFSRSSLFRNPWLQVRLRQAGGAEADLLLSAHPVEDPDYQAFLARTLPPGVTLRYGLEGEETQRRFVLMTREDAKIRLIEDGRVTRTEPLTLQRPFIVEKGLSVTPLARFEQARFEADFAPNPDPEAPFRPALRLRVWDPATGTAESRWLQGAGEDGRPVGAAFLGGRIRLVYGPKAPDLRDLRASLAVADGSGTPLVQGVATAGRPLTWQGWRFYVAGAGEETGVCRVRVARDPGLPLAWVAAGCLLAGLVGALLERGRGHAR